MTPNAVNVPQTTAMFQLAFDRLTGRPGAATQYLAANATAKGTAIGVLSFAFLELATGQKASDGAATAATDWQSSMFRLECAYDALARQPGAGKRITENARLGILGKYSALAEAFLSVDWKRAPAPVPAVVPRPTSPPETKPSAATAPAIPPASKTWTERCLDHSTKHADEIARLESALAGAKPGSLTARCIQSKLAELRTAVPDAREKEIAQVKRLLANTDSTVRRVAQKRLDELTNQP